MKKLLCLVAGLLVLSLGAQERGAWKGYVLLSWEYQEKAFPDLSMLSHGDLWAILNGRKDVAEVITNWPGITASTAQAFRVYASTNILEPMTNWRVVKVVGGTNRSARVDIEPGSWWFSVTVSNWWGESDFSGVAWVPGPPQSDARLFLDYGREVVP